MHFHCFLLLRAFTIHVAAIFAMGNDVIRVDVEGVQTNLVMIETVMSGFTADALQKKLSQVCVKLNKY